MSLLLALLLAQAAVDQTVSLPGTPARRAVTIQGSASSTPLSVNVLAMPAGGSGLTDAELRATPVPISGSVTTSGTATVSQATGSNLHVVVDTAPTTGVTGTFWPASAASTPTTYATAAAAVAQRPTTVATAPTAGTLTAATATSVYAGANGICQVAVANRDAAISMYCGQTSAVSATVGLPVSPGGVYTTSYGYGGALYCFPASGTPAYSIQVTSCP